MIVKQGYARGFEFEREGLIAEVLGSDQLVDLDGLPVMIQAMALGAYEQSDEPFYYGKINHLGYIISHRDLYGE